MGAIHLAGEEMNLIFKDRDVQVCKKMHKNGWDVWDISKVLKRDPDEVAVLIIDLAKRGLLEGDKNEQ